MALLTIAQAAERLGYSTRTVERMVEHEELTVVDVRRPGAARRRPRISEEELARYLRDRAPAPA